MLIFACCIGPSGKFETVASPAVESIMAETDVLIKESGSDGICAAYNRVINRARSMKGCEGIVFFHDDTKLLTSAREEILNGLALPNIGVIGVVGGSGLYDVTWNDARQRRGIVNDTRTRAGTGSGRLVYSETGQAVDTVDGLLMIVAPAAFNQLAFDAAAFPRFHGYDTDFCLSTRSIGLEVAVVDIPYEHHDKASYGDLNAFEEAASLLRDRWPQYIKPLSTREAIRLEMRRALKSRHTGRLRHVLGLVLKGRAREIPLQASSTP